jgi:hypothetical protein
MSTLTLRTCGTRRPDALIESSVAGSKSVVEYSKISVSWEVISGTIPKRNHFLALDAILVLV